VQKVFILNDVFVLEIFDKSEFTVYLVHKINYFGYRGGSKKVVLLAGKLVAVRAVRLELSFVGRSFTTLAYFLL
jgi:hypothetical protein